MRERLLKRSVAASAAPRSNGSGRLNHVGGRNGAAKTTAPRKEKTYFASGFPTPHLGSPLPKEFVTQVRRLEVMLKMPVWMLIQNGSKDFCCSSICPHILNSFQELRPNIKKGQPVALLLDSPGGDAHFAYTIARFFQRRTTKFTAVVPRYAKSAATLLALGASELILGKDAELGPLDVQMPDRDRENVGSALDAVQSLEQVNIFSLTAIDQLTLMMAQRTGKKLDTLLPLVFKYATDFVRPLLEKLDTVDFTQKSRELKVAEEYAMRLMQRNYPMETAKRIAAHLVEKYPTHGFVIDRDEAQTSAVRGETYGLGLKLRETPEKMEGIFLEMQPYLNSISVVGQLVEVAT